MLLKRLGQSVYVYNKICLKNPIKIPVLAVSISCGGPSLSLTRNIKSLVLILELNYL